MNIRPGWKCILHKAVSGQSVGRDIYVKEHHAPIYEKLKQDMQANFHLVSLFRAINDLNSKPLNGEAIVPAGNIRQLEMKGVRLEYYLDGGDVLINTLEFNTQFSAPDEQQVTGVYSAKYNGDAWALDKQVEIHGALDFSHKWGGSQTGAHYAAVSGKMINKERAGNMLGSHIVNAYKDDVTKAQAEVKGNAYSLYWVNGEHTSIDAKSGLTSLIQQAAKAKQPVHWLVHGEGAQTLESALVTLKDAPSLSRFAAQDEDTVRYLMQSMSKQKFFLSNPKGANIKNIAKLAKRVGVTFDEAKMVNTSNRDLSNIGTYRNLQSELLKTSCKVVAGGGLTTYVGYDLISKNYDKLYTAAGAMIQNPSFTSGITAVGVIGSAFFAFKSALQKQSNRLAGLRAAYATTVGDGNDYWYTSDADLIQQLRA